MNLRRQFDKAEAAVLCALAAGLLVAQGVHANPIDDIRLSRIGDLTTTEIELGCAMRYLDHSPTDGGMELRVSVELGYDCVNTLRGIRNALHRPQGGRLAGLTEIEFDTVAVGRAQITLRFERPVTFEVGQTANQYMLTIESDAGAGAPPVQVAPAAPPAPPAPPIPAVAPAVAGTVVVDSHNEGPSRRVERPLPPPEHLFVVRLAGLEAPETKATLPDLYLEKHVAYANDVVVDGREWSELRLGFFENEGAALAVLEDLREAYPQAWVTLAAPEEQSHAAANRLQAAGSAARNALPPPPVSAREIRGRPDPLSAERVSLLMAEAKEALVDGDFDRSISVYSRVLEEPVGAHRAQAREFLGVARQKNGQLAHAKSEFTAYLEEFPEGQDSRRVQQRLAALSQAANRAETTTLQAEPIDTLDRWSYYGGVAQFYLHGVNVAEADEANEIAQSALLSQAMIVVDRRGDRFDLMTRANVSYLHNFVDSGSDNQALVSFAYLDVNDTALELSARVGRQTRHKSGVLGRFDGANLSYGFKPNLLFNVTAGFPVDSPRHLADPNHHFYGASVEVLDIADAWDLSAFTNIQNIDGISDRQAFGAEAQYHSSRFNVVGLVDFDASYSVLNTGLLIGSWRVNDRLTLNGRYRGGTNPFLTSRNALIGQPVNTIDALLETYSEGQIRRLARNRTAQISAGSVGLSAELSERLQFNVDASFSEFGSTPSSGGVEGFPGTGPQYLYRGYLLGSSLFKAGDTVILDYRRFDSRDVTSDTLIFDLRYPIGEGLRINPRVAVTLQNRNEDTGEVLEHLIARPMLRVLYRGQRRYRIELEIGGQWSDRELPPALVSPLDPDNTLQTSAYYAQLGYWLDF